MVTKKRSGTRLAVFGVVVGLLLGLAVLAVKRVAASQLIALLSSEVESSCACSFAVDSVDVSLLRFRAVARNPRIESDGKVALRFTKIEADFSLSNWRQRQILINDLRLIQGTAQGVGEESPTFKFIDYLAAPIAPERDRPDRWRLRLLGLTLVDSAFFEPLGGLMLRGNGVQLRMARAADDNFELKPEIEALELAYVDDAQAAPIQLGKISGTLKIDDLEILWPKIHSAIGESAIELSAISRTKEKNALSGSGTVSLDAKAIMLPDWVTGLFVGTGTLGGTLGAPTFQGSFQSAEGSPLKLTPGSTAFSEFENVKGDFRLQLGGPGTRFELTRFQSPNASSSLALDRPLVITQSTISGSADLRLETAVLADMQLHDLQLKINIGGSLEHRTVLAQGRVGALDYGPIRTPALDLVVQGDGDRWAGTAIHLPDDLGAVTVKFELTSASPDGIALTGIDLKASNLRVSGGEQAVELVPLRISGHGSGSRGSVTEPFTGRFQGTAVAENTLVGVASSLNIQANLAGSGANIELRNASGTLTGMLKLPAPSGQNGSFSANLRGFSPSELFPAIRCTAVDADLDYRFAASAPLSGDGQIAITSFSFGCAPHVVRLESAAKLPIADGTIVVPKLSWSGPNSNYALSGTVGLGGGLNISAKGRLELHSLLAFIPAADDLLGEIEGTVHLYGDMAEPSLTGSAVLRDGGVVVEAAGIDGEQINGEIVFDGSQIQFANLGGVLNDGSVRADGRVDLRAVARSTLTIELQNVAIHPIESSTIIGSGQLKLASNDQGLPRVEGQIQITQGILERQIDLVSFVGSLAKLLLPSTSVTTSGSAIPDVELDISIDAPRNIAILTNWLGTELRGNLRITGLLARPSYDGALESLTGWFGIRNRRFDIISGQVTFRPTAIEPEIEVIGESTIWTRFGDTTLILVEIAGPITNPSVTLTSDRGLSQQEILNIVAAGGRTDISGLATPAGSSSLSLIPTLGDDEESFGITRLLHALTTIDSIALEPKYNVQRGVVDPAVVATKGLLPGLALVGETFLSDGGGEASVGFDYLLNQRVGLSGRAISEESQQQTSFGLDLTLTVLEKQDRLLEVVVSGNQGISTDSIQQVLKLSNASRVTLDHLPTLTDQLQTFYHDRGYFESAVTLACPRFDQFCRELSIEVQEGNRSYIDAIELRGELPDDIEVPRALRTLPEKEPATTTFLNRHQRRLIQALRSEGYISARVHGVLEDRGLPNSRTLVYEVRAGRPVTFVFTGNRLFTAEEFLSTINLFTRTQPFGPNTANILAQNVERLYRGQGYLHVHIDLVRDDVDSQGRVRYRFGISEGTQIKVGEVVFRGLHSMTEEDLLQQLNLRFPGQTAYSFTPEFAVAEDLDSGTAMIREIYNRRGFPDADVRYQLSRDTIAQQVRVEYLVEEGEVSSFQTLTVGGWPGDLQAIELPPAPHSPITANELVDRLRLKLRKAGFSTSEIRTVVDPTESRLTIEVEPGPPTLIGELLIRGESAVSHTVIIDELTVHPGDRWSEDALQESRKRLLQLGLFSRIDIGPADGAVDSVLEDLEILVTERPLQTLEVGTGANSEYGLRLFTEAVDRGLFGDGRTLSLLADAFYDEREQGISRGVLSLRFYSPTLLSTPFGFSQDLRYQKLDLSTQEYDLDRLSLASYVYHIWDSGLSISAGHTVLEDFLDNVSPGAVLSDLDTGSVRMSYLSGALGYDRRDNPLNPGSGYNLTLDYRLASSAIGSQADFFGVEGKGSAIEPFTVGSSRFAIANLVRVGSQWGFADTDEIPITQRYYLGGRSTVRGFRENSLGPRGTDGAVIGGDLLLSNNFELRYLSSESMMLLAFLDIGNVFLRDESVELSDLRRSAGVGVRYISPIGPLGIDIGHPLDEQSGEPSWRLHFSLGSTF